MLTMKRVILYTSDHNLSAELHIISHVDPMTCYWLTGILTWDCYYMSSLIMVLLLKVSPKVQAGPLVYSLPNVNLFLRNYMIALFDQSYPIGTTFGVSDNSLA